MQVHLSSGWEIYCADQVLHARFVRVGFHQCLPGFGGGVETVMVYLQRPASEMYKSQIKIGKNGAEGFCMSST